MPSDYRATFAKDPFILRFDMTALKSGTYLIKGEAGQEPWANACQQIGVPAAGGCTVALDMTKKSGFLTLKGTIDTRMERVCVRTLESFELEEHHLVDEVIALSPKFDEEDSLVVLEGDTFDVGDFITQHIIINMASHPVHPRTLSSKNNAFDLSDGLESDIVDEKNPFSVLKNLKSSS